MKKNEATKGTSPSWLIDARIKELDDWRGKRLAHVRGLIKQADAEVVEEWNEGDEIDKAAFKTPMRAAVALNPSR